MRSASYIHSADRYTPTVGWPSHVVIYSDVQKRGDALVKNGLDQPGLRPAKVVELQGEQRHEAHAHNAH
jgi:hypothetical protein